MKQQDKKNCLMMWVPAYWSFLRSFYNSGFSHYGAWRWSRTTTRRFFRPVLRTASKLSRHMLDANEKFGGLEPTYRLFNRQLLYQMS